MIRRSVIALLGFAIAATPVSSIAQDAPRTFDLGPVTEVSTVRVEPGQLRQYMAYLNGTWRQSLEDGKRRGDILSYTIYEPMDGKDADGNLLLAVTYKNAAVLDTPLDVLDQRTAALQGSVAAAESAGVARGHMRTILGTRIYRELSFRGPPSR